MNKKDIMQKVSKMDEKKFIKYTRAEDVVRQLVLKAVPIIAGWIELDTKNITIADVMVTPTNSKLRNIYDMIWTSLKYDCKIGNEDKSIVIGNYWCFYKFYKMAKAKDISAESIEFYMLFIRELIKALLSNKDLIDDVIYDDENAWHDETVDNVYNTHLDEIKLLCTNVLMICDVSWAIDPVGAICIF